MNFVKGSLFTVISKAIMFFSSLFISIYVARILGPEAKGMYYLLVQMVSIVALLGMFGITNSAVYFLGKEKESRSELYGHFLFLTILSSAIFLIFIMTSHNFLLDSILKGIPRQYAHIMTFAIPLLMLSQIFLSMILGLNKIVMYNVFEIACYFLLFLNFIIFAVGFRMGIYGAYFGFVITYLLIDSTFILLFIKKINLHLEWGKIKNILNYGLRTYLGPICFLLICRVDSFMLNLYSNVRQVGFYSIAVSFAELLPFVPLAVGTVLFPKLVSQEIEILNASTARVVRVIFPFLILLGLAFFLIGKWMILFMYGKIYIPSVIPMNILLPGFVFISLYYLFFSYFNAIGKPGIVAVILVITLFVKLFLSIFAIPKWGIIGAATTSTVSYLLCGLLFLAAFWVKSKRPLREIFIIRNADIQYAWNIFVPTLKINKA